MIKPTKYRSFREQMYWHTEEIKLGAAHRAAEAEMLESMKHQGKARARRAPVSDTGGGRAELPTLTNSRV